MEPVSESIFTNSEEKGISVGKRTGQKNPPKNKQSRTANKNSSFQHVSNSVFTVSLQVQVSLICHSVSPAEGIYRADSTKEQ